MGPRLRTLSGATLRANPAFELASAPHGGPRRRNPVSTDPSPTFRHVLHPVGAPWLGVRALDEDAATLFRALIKPRALPARLHRALGRDANRTIATFVLDGILEIDGPRGFASGADAHGLVVRQSVSMVARGKTATLSLDALTYASTLPIDDADRLSARLYFYNRRPATSHWRARLSDARAVEMFVRLTPGSRTRAILDRDWRQNGEPSGPDDWSAWKPRAVRPRHSRRSGTLKLYVSPDPDHTADAIEAVIATLADAGTVPFKFGAGVYSLLRPDKLVLYFENAKELFRIAAAIRRRLDGVAAHGVPFSADIGGDGLVSWGLDPEDAGTSWPHVESRSWRIAIVSRLARSLTLAKHATTWCTVDPRQFALDRLALDGVDVATWTPGRA